MNDSDKGMIDTLAVNLQTFLRGDLDAVRFCVSLYAMCQTWDDLVDRDKDVDRGDINAAFRTALLDIPANPFFRKYADILLANMLSIFLQWQDANELEKTNDEHDRELAWMTRYSLTQIFPVCAALVGGIAWAAEVGPDMRRMLTERFEDFGGKNA